jgi:hypothetical protein
MSGVTKRQRFKERKMKMKKKMSAHDIASPSYQRAEEDTIRVWGRRFRHLRLMPDEWNAIVEAAESAESKGVYVDDAIEQAFFVHANRGTRNSRN